MTAEHILRVEERRTGRRFTADFYAVELSGSGRYLRRVRNVSDDGLLLENPLADAFPGVVAGIKDSSGDAAHTLNLITAFPERNASRVTNP